MPTRIRMYRNKITKSYYRFEPPARMAKVVGHFYVSRDLLPSKPSAIDIVITPIDEEMLTDQEKSYVSDGGCGSEDGQV